MSNSNFINLDQLSLTTQSLLRKINEQSNLKVDKNTIISTTSNGSVIASINGIDIYNGETFSGNYYDLKNVPNFVESVNGDYSANITVSSLQPYDISDNTEYNLIGVARNNANSLKQIYNITPVSLLKNSTYPTLRIGNKASSNSFGVLQLYKGGSSSNTGYIQIQPGTLETPQLSTVTNVLSLPHQSGTIALLSDIPNWARSSTKPTYTATEVGALPSSTTYVSTFNGQSGAITYTAPVTSVNGQTGVVNLNIPNVPEWALATTKPAYTATEVGALPDTTTIPTKINDLTEYKNFGIGYIDCTNTNRYIFVSNVNFSSSGSSDYSSYFLFMLIRGTQNSSNPVTIAGTGSFYFYDINNNTKRNDYWVQISSEKIATLKYGTLYIARLNDGDLELYPLTTTSEVNSLITSAIGDINSFEASVVASLPTSDIDTHTIYFVSNSSSGDNIYDEYMYINSNWEKIGSTSVDLSNYLQKTDISDWAKASTKPVYTASEVGAAASNHTHTSIGITGRDNRGKVTTTSQSVEINAYIGQGGESNIILDPGKIKLLASTKSSVNNTTSIIFSTYPYEGNSEIQHIKLSDGATTINGVVTPTTNDMAANKKYVDDSIATITHPTNISAFNNDVGYLTSFTETDPTVPAWAKAANKPTYTASEVGAAASNHTHSKISYYGGSGDGYVEVSANRATIEASTNGGGTQNILTLTGTTTTIHKVVTPTADGDAANKKYVDDSIAAITHPTNVSTFINDAGYLTLADLPIYDGTVV